MSSSCQQAWSPTINSNLFVRFRQTWLPRPTSRMFRDRLQSLQQRAQRWGSKRYRVRSGSIPAISSSADGSDDTLRVLRRVDVIRTDIQHMTSELPAVREAQHRLLVAVDVQDRLDLQARLGKLCDRSKRAQLLLSSLDSLRQGEIPDSTLMRILVTQQMALSRSLLELVEQLRECEEELATVVKKRECRSHSLGILSDCTVLPISIRICKSQLTHKAACCPEICEKVQEEVFLLDSRQTDELMSVESQLSQIRQVSLVVSELVSVPNDLINNIEHNVKVPHSFKMERSFDSEGVSRRLLHSV